MSSIGGLPDFVVDGFCQFSEQCRRSVAVIPPRRGWSFLAYLVWLRLSRAAFISVSRTSRTQLTASKIRSLKKVARKRSSQGDRGWLAPDGQFFESDETPAIRIVGLELGGHERAVLQWLEANRPDLLDFLEEERIASGYECWEESDGKDIIKKFMFKHGFLRVSPD